MIAEGEAAPDFELVSGSGEQMRLSLLRGRPVVLYFYPRDDTPGCTTPDKEERMVEEGTPAPAFDAETEDGTTVTLDDLRGKPVVLFFYPKDETPGCTTQACGIRDAWGEFRSRGIEVFGVSRDDASSHRQFRETFELPFSLLVDSDRSLGDAFGVADIKDGVPAYKRTTVVIDADGNVAKTMENVDPATHADDVLGLLG